METKIPLNLLVIENKKYISYDSLIKFTNSCIGILGDEQEEITANTVTADCFQMLKDLFNFYIEKYKLSVDENPEIKYHRCELTNSKINATIGLTSCLNTDEVFMDTSDITKMIRIVKLEYVKFINENYKDTKPNILLLEIMDKVAKLYSMIEAEPN